MEYKIKKAKGKVTEGTKKREGFLTEIKALPNKLKFSLVNFNLNAFSHAMKDKHIYHISTYDKSMFGTGGVTNRGIPQSIYPKKTKNDNYLKGFFQLITDKERLKNEKK